MLIVALFTFLYLWYLNHIQLHPLLVSLLNTSYSTGYYPHPSVPPHPGVANVQKEVVYCPDLKFCAFDVAITSSQQQNRSMLIKNHLN